VTTFSWPPTHLRTWRRHRNTSSDTIVLHRLSYREEEDEDEDEDEEEEEEALGIMKNDSVCVQSVTLY
jgi:hypothetical protein